MGICLAEPAPSPGPFSSSLLPAENKTGQREDDEEGKVRGWVSENLLQAGTAAEAR